jgi:hypothetical protein
MGKYLSHIFYFALAVAYFSLNATAQQQDFRPLKKPITDSLNTGKDSSGVTSPSASDNDFTSHQDSAFFTAMNLRIPTGSRLQYDLALSENAWRLQKDIENGSPWQIAINNIRAIPREYFAPDPADVYNHEYNIQQALSVPYMNTYNPYGLKIPLGAIGKLLGLVQDVSPKMAFELDYNAEVEIVIYSVQASVVATIFKGSKKPGYHTYTWNGRNDQGKKMPPGDYIGEIRIGNRKYIRKRIVIY